jgi:hypothetical protein
MIRARPTVRWPALVVALFIVTCVGCASTSNHALITRPSASGADLIRSPVAFEDLGPVKGRACRFFLVALIPFGNSTPGAAIDKALEGTDADAVLNASVTTSLYGFVPIYNVLSFTCTTVQGVAIRFERPRPSGSSASTPGTASADRDRAERSYPDDSDDDVPAQGPELGDEETMR